MTNQPPPLDTPWPAINPLVDLTPGAITTVASPVSVGKSMFAQNIATRAALHHNVGTAFCTAEVTNRDMMARFLAERASIDSARIRLAELDEGQRQTVEAAAAEFSAAPLVLSDPSGKGADLQQVVDALVKLRGRGAVPGLVVVDSFQTFTNPTDEAAQKAAMIVLRSIARKYGVAVLLVSFTDRPVTGDPESDAVPAVVVEGSDAVVTLHRQTGNRRGDVGPSMFTTVRCVKEPEAGGAARLVLEPEFARFVERDS